MHVCFCHVFKIHIWYMPLVFFLLKAFFYIMSNFVLVHGGVYVWVYVDSLTSVLLLWWAVFGVSDCIFWCSQPCEECWGWAQVSITYHAKWLGSVWSTFRNPGGPEGRGKSLMPNSPNLATSAQHSPYFFGVLVIKTIIVGVRFIIISCCSF